MGERVWLSLPSYRRQDFYVCERFSLTKKWWSAEHRPYQLRILVVGTSITSTRRRRDVNNSTNLLVSYSTVPGTEDLLIHHHHQEESEIRN